ncbi:MAG: glycosyltransferase family 2 protein [Chloroflexi bacterium]|nr:glycosyltransferase family 2 protein [Chloroflexota bacterium]
MGDDPLPVVIVSYNTRELLRGCLSALLRSEGVTLEPIVVDNASSDGSAATVTAEFPCVRLLAQDVNRGFAAANNTALKSLHIGERGAPEFALLLNPDTAVRPDAVATMRAFMCAHPRAALAGPQLIFPDGSFQHAAFRFPGLWQTFFDLFPLHPRLLDSRLNGRYLPRAMPFEIDHPLGACMLVRGEAVAQVGLMDEGYFMYVEEVDWCRRMKRAGWQVWCEPRAQVVHHAGQSTRQSRDAMYVAKWRSRLYYFRKFHSRVYVALVAAIIRIGMWHEAHALRTDLTREERDAQQRAFAQVRALL